MVFTRFCLNKGYEYLRQNWVSTWLPGLGDQCPLGVPYSHNVCTGESVIMLEPNVCCSELTIWDLCLEQHLYI